MKREEEVKGEGEKEETVADLEILKEGFSPKIFGLSRPLPVTLAVRTEYLEATTPSLTQMLEISKELIRECVTVPGCCCMPLLHNHLMDLCSYVRKNTLLAAKGVCTPLTPPPPPPSGFATGKGGIGQKWKENSELSGNLVNPSVTKYS